MKNRAKYLLSFAIAIVFHWTSTPGAAVPNASWQNAFACSAGKEPGFMLAHVSREKK